MPRLSPSTAPATLSDLVDALDSGLASDVNKAVSDFMQGFQTLSGTADRADSERAIGKMLHVLMRVLLAASSAGMYGLFRLLFMVTGAINEGAKPPIVLQGSNGTLLVQIVKHVLLAADSGPTTSTGAAAAEDDDDDDGDGDDDGDDSDSLRAVALQTAEEMSPPCQALVGPSPQVLALIQSDVALMSAIDRLRWKGPGLKMLHTLLRTFESERLLVLVPDHQRGYEVEFGGLPDNSHLVMMLAARLMGTGPDDLPGTPPSSAQMDVLEGRVAAGRAGSWTNPWNMLNYTAVAPDGRLVNDDPAHFVWVEGVPADIARLHGRERVLVLGKAQLHGTTLVRSMSVVRVFSTLRPFCRRLRTLSTGEYTAKMAEIAALTPAERAAALRDISQHKCT